MKKPEFTTWKTQPIFISSTFTDMMAERDVLRDFVFPELEERLLERKIRIEAIDLRWGVETANKKEQEEKELLVLKVCLDEIDRSLPFFIGIIGDRYGWIPPKERLKIVEKEKGFISEIEDKSVTALEIEYGVLANNRQLDRSFFFFREPLPLDKISVDEKAKYADVFLKDMDKDFAEKRLANFKNLIEEKVGKDKVFTYKTQWDTENNKVTGLDEFKQKVLDCLWKEIDEYTKEEKDERPITWQDEERVNFEEFIEGRTISFSGREDLINELKTFTRSKEGVENWGLCLNGESGGGKSALFSKVYRELKSDNDILVLGHAAGISLRSNSLNNMLTLWIEELAEELQADINEQLNKNLKFEDLKKLFSKLLSQVSVYKRVVVLVDALNQFENTNHAKFVNWIPDLIPANSKFIFTANAGEETENLSKRNGVIIQELKPINKTDAEGIIIIICNKYHKELNSQVIAKLLDKKKSDGSFAYSNALWLTMVIDEFLLLDEDDFRRMKGLKGSAEEKLLQLLLITADKLPSDIPGMYNYVFKRAGIFGDEFVNSILSYIGISRNGLRESDLEELINNYSNSKWDPLNFAAFRRYLRSHLVSKGEIGLWDFRHLQVRESLKYTLLNDDGKVQILHKKLAGHLKKLPEDDSLGLNEILWHLFKSKSKFKAAKIYSTNWWDNYKTDKYTNTVKDILLENELNTNWVISVFEETHTTEREKKFIINNIVFNLDVYIEDYVSLYQRLSILQSACRVAEKLTEQKPNSAEYARDLSNALSGAGDIYKDLGDIQNALNQYNNALSIAKELIEQDPDSAECIRDLYVLYINIGGIYTVFDDNHNALKNYESALQMTKVLHNRSPDSDFYTRDLSVSFEKIGDIYLAQGEIKNALEKFENALDISKDLYKRNPDSVDYAFDLSVSYAKKGDIHSVLKENKKALKNYKRALNISGKLNKQHPDSVKYARGLNTAYERIGDIFNAAGDFELALTNYESSLKIGKELRMRNPESVESVRALSVSHNNIGEIYKAKGDFQGALDNYKSALNIIIDLQNRNTDSNLHTRDLSVLYNSVGDIYTILNNTKSARNSYENSLKFSKELFDRNPDSAKYTRDLVISYIKLNKYDLLVDTLKYMKSHNMFMDSDLIEMCRELGIDEITLDKKHAKSADTEYNSGLEYYHKKEYEKALEHFFKALDIYKKVYGKEHQDVAKTLTEIADCYFMDNHYKEAISNHRAAQRILRKRFGELSEKVAHSYFDLGLDYYWNTQYKQAIKKHKKALEIRKNLFGENSEEFDKSRFAMAKTYYYLNIGQDAAEYFSASLRFRRKFYGRKSEEYIKAKEWIGKL